MFGKDHKSNKERSFEVISNEEAKKTLRNVFDNETEYDEEDHEEDYKNSNVKEIKYGLALRYKLIIWLLLILIFLLVGNYFLKHKCKITKFEITGNTWYTEEEIINAFKTKGYDDYSIFFKLHYTFGDMPKMAFVKDFTVKMVNLHTISIRIHEKGIVGNVKIMDDYMYFDKDGMIIASRSEIMNDIPTIDGLEFTRASVGSTLEVQDPEVFHDILEITQLIQKYSINVDKILFDKNVCVTLFCEDGNQIYIGRQSSYDVIMQAIPNILKAAEEKKATYKLDMSEFTSHNTTFKAEFLTRPDMEAPTPEPLPGEQPQENPPQNAPQETPQNTPQEAPQETPQDTPQEVPQEVPQETPQDNPPEEAAPTEGTTGEDVPEGGQTEDNQPENLTDEEHTDNETPQDEPNEDANAPENTGEDTPENDGDI